MPGKNGMDPKQERIGTIGDRVNRGPRHEISDFGMGLKIGVPGRKSLIFGWG